MSQKGRKKTREPKTLNRDRVDKEIMKNTCIYCGSEGKFTKEHASPKVLEQDDNYPNWRIDKRVCSVCNNEKLSMLDETLAQQSLLGIIHSQIMAELGHSASYGGRKHQADPLRHSSFIHVDNRTTEMQVGVKITGDDADTIEQRMMRGLCKVAFHSLLYLFPEYAGHEEIFQEIRDFIYSGIGDPNGFISANPIQSDPDNLAIYTTTQFLHSFRFDINTDEIWCRINMFTGLEYPIGTPHAMPSFPGVPWSGLFPIIEQPSWKIRLSDNSNIGRQQQGALLYVPYHVSPDTTLKKLGRSPQPMDAPLQIYDPFLKKRFDTRGWVESFFIDSHTLITDAGKYHMEMCQKSGCSICMHYSKTMLRSHKHTCEKETCSECDRLAKLHSQLKNQR